MTGSKHSNSLGNSCEVLVVMDLQPRLLSSISGSSSLLNANSILLRASEFLEIPTIITEQVPDKLGKNSSPYHRVYCKSPSDCQRLLFCLWFTGVL